MHTKITAIFFSAFISHWVFAQDSVKISSKDLKLYPLLYHQTAAEYRALCYQAFNTAKLRLDNILKQYPNRKDLAIITDLDETILDNSSIEVQKMKTGKEINYKEWITWLNKPGLPTVPGGVEFLQYAGSKNLSVFYISNRDVKGLEITISTLQKLKLPDADTSHILLLSNDFSKEERRQKVMKDYNVVMLLGDNLNDFMPVFESRKINERLVSTDSLKNEWGKKFIVLPNLFYGEWDNALFNYKDVDSLPVEQKILLLRNLLRGFSN